MIDKVTIAAENCWTSECQDLRRDINSTIKDAYIRGFKRGVEKVRNRQPQTKADKIRAMSDGELAEYSFKVLSNYACPPKRESYTKTCNKFNHHCRDCWIDWLKSGCSDDEL